jgi:hypothetical protein
VKRSIRYSRLEFRINSAENHQRNHVYRPKTQSSHSCGHELLKTLKKDVGVLLLEDQHRPEADGLSSRATDVDADGLSVLQDLITSGRVPGDEGTLALTTEVLDLFGELGSKALEAGVEVGTSLGGVLNEVLVLDLVEDGAEEDSTSRVAEPAGILLVLCEKFKPWMSNLRVELTVGLVGSELRVAVEVACSLGLLGEGDHVRRVLQVPVVVSPEFASGTDTSLDLIDNHENVVLAGNSTEASEEGRRGVVVATLRLNGLDNNGGRWAVEGGNDLLNLFEAALLLASVLLSVLLKRILELREGSLGPVESRDVELVDRFGAGGGEGAEETAVEAATEGQDRHVGCARCLVVHRRLNVLLGELDIVSTTLLLSLVHESCLVGKLVGIGTSSSGKDLVKTLGRSTQETSLENLGPVVGRKVAHGGTVDQCRGHLGAHGGLEQGGVAVTNGDRGDLGVDVQQDIAVKVGDVVAEGVLVVAHHVQAPGLVDLVQLCNCLLALWTGELSAHDGTGGLVCEKRLLIGIGDGALGGGRRGGARRALSCHSAGEGGASAGTQDGLQPRGGAHERRHRGGVCYLVGLWCGGAGDESSQQAVRLQWRRSRG